MTAINSNVVAMATGATIAVLDEPGSRPKKPPAREVHLCPVIPTTTMLNARI